MPEDRLAEPPAVLRAGTWALDRGFELLHVWIWANIAIDALKAFGNVILGHYALAWREMHVTVIFYGVIIGTVFVVALGLAVLSGRPVKIEKLLERIRRPR